MKGTGIERKNWEESEKLRRTCQGRKGTENEENAMKKNRK